MYCKLYKPHKNRLYLNIIKNENVLRVASYITQDYEVQKINDSSLLSFISRPSLLDLSCLRAMELFVIVLLFGFVFAANNDRELF